MWISRKHEKNYLKAPFFGKKFMKKIIISMFCLGVIAVIGFASLEADSVDAASSIATTTATLTVDSDLSLTGCAAITMQPNIGLSQDSSVGTSTCTVETTNATGYAMTVYATSSPALQSGSNSFQDYATTTGPSTWSVAGGEYRFGYTVFGTDVSTSNWGSGTNCGAAGSATYTPDGTLKHLGFMTTATTTASRGTATGGGGIATTLCVAAEQGDSANAPSGTYVATIVVTAATQ